MSPPLQYRTHAPKTNPEVVTAAHEAAATHEAADRAHGAAGQDPYAAAATGDMAADVNKGTEWFSLHHTSVGISFGAVAAFLISLFIVWSCYKSNMCGIFNCCPGPTPPPPAHRPHRVWPPPNPPPPGTLRYPRPTQPWSPPTTRTPPSGQPPSGRPPRRTGSPSPRPSPPCRPPGPFAAPATATRPPPGTTPPPRSAGSSWTPGVAQPLTAAGSRT